MDHYAVVGNPIAHSKSPEIHTLFAAQTQQALIYDKMLVELGGFNEEVSAFFALGGKGLNVTVPFKEQAARYADRLTERARVAEAVNTLIVEPDGSVTGDTTDGAGLVADLQALGWPVAGQRVLLLGAGGAVRGVVQPLLELSPERLYIANRTLAKAQAIAERLQYLGPVVAGDYASLVGQTFDVIINGTSAGLAGELPPLPEGVITPQTRVYDMAYSAGPTPLLSWAAARGASHMADGLGMLVGQAAESFYLWRGLRPDVRPVMEALRLKLMQVQD